MFICSYVVEVEEGNTLCCGPLTLCTDGAKYVFLCAFLSFSEFKDSTKLLLELNNISNLLDIDHRR